VTGLRFGRERDHRTDIEVAIGPAVEPAADAIGERVVDGGMAHRAREADRAQRALCVEEALHADDRVELEQRERRLGAVEVDLALLDGLDDGARKRGGVDLEADRQRALRAQSRSHAAEPGSLDRLVQLQCAAPEGLVAEGVEAEDLPALAEESLLGARASRGSLLRRRSGDGADVQQERSRQHEGASCRDEHQDLQARAPHRVHLSRRRRIIDLFVHLADARNHNSSSGGRQQRR
jgi:hypothetical protein